MDIEILRPSCYLIEYFFQCCLGNTSSFNTPSHRPDSFKIMLDRFVFVIFFIKNFLVVFFVLLQISITLSIDFFFGKNTFLNDLFWVNFINWWFIFNYLVHFGLSEERLILLIMAIFSKPNNIDEDIFFELKSVLDCNFYASVKKPWLITVNMEDWCSNHLCDLSTVITWSCLVWVGCETNLIVHHDVNDASWSIVFQILHFSWFVHNTLAG